MSRGWRTSYAACTLSVGHGPSIQFWRVIRLSVGSESLCLDPPSSNHWWATTRQHTHMDAEHALPCVNQCWMGRIPTWPTS